MSKSGKFAVAESFRDAMRLFPTGVTVVTTTNADQPYGMTANAVSSLSLEPPMVLVCFEREARTLAAVRGSRAFAINVLATTQQKLAKQFATKHSESIKWKGISWQQRGDLPMLDGALCWIGCSLSELIEAGDHMIAVGTVNSVATGEGSPLIYYRGLFGSIGAQPSR